MKLRKEKPKKYGKKKLMIYNEQEKKFVFGCLLHFYEF